ncbi:alkene reductase [uncultured Paraglaciecola sp.]|uniref:alkene reductase n=1 Tax=uncultured Paraglaciecola sp. TaxID=1765024 RepID=UPI0030DCC05F|tara:strand:+ start:8889 stop:9953 length:1065 start_codon:yes stop_codon:yes gene_type:complete
MSDLFSSIQLGNTQLANRIIMAPLTRARASDGHMPNQMMATYYQQRASAGLIITEATMITAGNSAFVNEPGIYNQEQISAWKKVTEAVHAKNGKIYLQIWHGGRATHSVLNDGQQPVGPSAIAIDDVIHTPQGKMPYEVPRALRTDEMPGIVDAFRQAARNAILAGFDGVEVHGANGYLIDQFLRSSANIRSDKYGGSIENRTRFLLDVVDAVSDEIGSAKVGLRLSPLNSFNSMQDEDTRGLLAFVSKALSSRNLAYLHVMRADFFDKQHGDVLAIAREHYSGNLIANMGYTASEASQAIKTNSIDAVAFGTGFISNPDLPLRIENNLELAPADQSTFYLGGAEGYIDYPVAS